MDRIMQRFLETQMEEARQLSKESDLVTIVPLDPSPSKLYLVSFTCRGLVEEGGKVQEANRFDVGLCFPEDYWREVRPEQIITVLSPTNVFHPNIRFPYVCIGTIYPGTGLVELVTRLFQVITYRKFGLREDDALNPEAATWAAAHRSSFPLDDRPLRSGGLRFRVRG